MQHYLASYFYQLLWLLHSRTANQTTTSFAKNAEHYSNIPASCFIVISFSISMMRFLFFTFRCMGLLVVL